MALPDYPITRSEQYLNNIATGSGELPEYPITREEQYLEYIAEHGGGGGDSERTVILFVWHNDWAEQGSPYVNPETGEYDYVILRGSFEQEYAKPYYDIDPIIILPHDAGDPSSDADAARGFLTIVNRVPFDDFEDERIYLAISDIGTSTFFAIFWLADKIVVA